MRSHDLVRHGDAQIVLHEFRIAQAGQRPDARNDGNAKLLDALEESLQQLQVEYRLGNRIFGSRLYLVSETANLRCP